MIRSQLTRLSILALLLAAMVFGGIAHSALAQDATPAAGPIAVTEVILEPGDAIYYEADVVHTARGAGDEAAVVHATLVLETGAPLLMTPEQMSGMDHGATPES
jgi:hypothetical protein